MGAGPVDVQALLQVLKDSPASADLQISAFSAALQHYRRATVTTPFPSQFTDSKGQKDFAACQGAMSQLPAVTDMLSEAHLSQLQPSSLGLLQWLLLPTTRRQNRFQQVTKEQFLQDLACHEAATCRPVFTRTSTPTQFLWRLSNDSSAAEASKFAQPTIAYHGTCMENLHSILNTGLLNLSSSRLQRNGAIFGEGIYLSTRYEVAFSFSKPADTWQHSQLGSRARCLLVCEVDLDKTTDTSIPLAQQKKNQASAAGLSGAGQKSGDKSLPDSYLVVSRPDAIRLLYVLVFSDARPTARHNVSWSLMVVGMYALGLLLQWLLRNKELQLFLRQKLRRSAGLTTAAPAWQHWG